MQSQRETSSGIGFAGLLTILFIGLKLGHVITWSWWWVAPLWAPAVLALGVIGLVSLAALVMAVSSILISRN